MGREQQVKGAAHRRITGSASWSAAMNREERVVRPWKRSTCSTAGLSGDQAGSVQRLANVALRPFSGYRYCDTYLSLPRPNPAAAPPPELVFGSNHFWLEQESSLCHIDIDAFLAEVVGRWMA
jgi:hypothetical protein